MGNTTKKLELQAKDTSIDYLITWNQRIGVYYADSILVLEKCLPEINDYNLKQAIRQQIKRFYQETGSLKS